MHYNAEAIGEFLRSGAPDTALSAHLCVCGGCRRLYERARDVSEIFSGGHLMPGITLAPEQWIYCAAVIGGEAFEGLPDPLSRCDDCEREGAYEQARKALEAKGLIEVAFDGTVGLRKRLYKIVDACVNFERFLTLTRRSPGKRERVCNIYEKGGCSVVMYVDARKGCTAVKRGGKVFFAENPFGGEQSGKGERFTPEDLQMLRDEAKGFGNFGDFSSGGEVRGAVFLAMSGSAEYYSVTEIVAAPGKRGRLSAGAFINTYEGGYEVVYNTRDKDYEVFAVRKAV